MPDPIADARHMVQQLRGGYDEATASELADLIDALIPKADRRERIATAALAGLMANPREQNDSLDWAQAYAKVAIDAADALIKGLDK